MDETAGPEGVKETTPTVCQHVDRGSIWELVLDCEPCKEAGEPSAMRGHGYVCTRCGFKWLLPFVTDRHNASPGHLEGLKALETRAGVREETADLRAEKGRLFNEVQHLEARQRALEKAVSSAEAQRGAPARSQRAPSGPTVRCERCGASILATNFARHVKRERSRRRKKPRKSSSAAG